jgi:hypothetical protein
MNTVKFRGIAGWVKKEADLWPLRDILFELQTDIQEWGANTDLNLKEMGYRISDIAGRNPVVLMVEALEHDIMVIETYCTSNHIQRP